MNQFSPTHAVYQSAGLAGLMAQSEAEEGEGELERLTEGHDGTILSLSNLPSVPITQLYLTDSPTLQPKMKMSQRQQGTYSHFSLRFVK